jgi:hypothetical protein
MMIEWDIRRKIIYMMMIEWDIRRKIIYISGMNGTMVVFFILSEDCSEICHGIHGDWISMIFHWDMDPRMKRFEEIIVLWIQVWGRWGGVIFWDIDQSATWGKLRAVQIPPWWQILSHQALLVLSPHLYPRVLEIAICSCNATFHGKFPMFLA